MTRAAGFDVAVIGAGAAGLAAAVDLARAGRQVCILEARNRLGGRILTRSEPHVPVPLELGAEFLHGRPEATVGWLASGHSAIVDVPDRRWILRRGGLRPADDLFAALESGLDAVRRPRKDVAFGGFLDGAARKLPARVREFARMLVEGFDAADPARVSTLATLDEWSGAGAADAPTFRPQRGYAALIEALTAALPPSAVDLRLDTVVREIRWRRGAVEITAAQHGREVAVRAVRAIVTLPFGVLKAAPPVPGAVRFEPALDAKRAAFDGLAAGQALKVLLRFGTAFWEDLDSHRYRDAVFFHAPHAPFPTLWTTLPARTSVLTAWAGGPKAALLARRGKAAIVQAALASVVTMFGQRVAAPARLEAAYMHDWQTDPFARGAYCYVTVGGASARKLLAAPLADTLYFAGEAAATDGESGTVAGALQSGCRAARQVLSADAGTRRRK